SGGSMGGLYDPVRLEYDPDVGTKVPALQLSEELTPERLGDRKKLIQAFDLAERQSDLVRSSQAIDDYRGQAFSLLTSPSARKMFDLSREPEATIERFGRTRVVQSCLLGRRLVQNGVPFVQVNWSDHVEAEEGSGDGGWHHHYRNSQI